MSRAFHLAKWCTHLVLAATTGLLGGVAVHQVFWDFLWWVPRHRQILIAHWNAGTISQPFLLSGLAGVAIGVIACLLLRKVWQHTRDFLRSSALVSHFGTFLFGALRSRKSRRTTGSSDKTQPDVTGNSAVSVLGPDTNNGPPYSNPASRSDAQEADPPKRETPKQETPKQETRAETENAQPVETEPPQDHPPEAEAADAAEGQENLPEESEAKRRQRLHIEKKAAKDAAAASAASAEPSLAADPLEPAPEAPPLSAQLPTLRDHCRMFIRLAGYMEIPVDPREPGKIGLIAADGRSAYAFCFVPENTTAQAIEAAGSRTRRAAGRFYDGLTGESWLDEDDPDNGIQAKIFLVGPANSTRPTNTEQSLDLHFITLPDPPPFLDEDARLDQWQDWLVQIPESDRTVPDESLSTCLATYFEKG
jgi:hypothetical protein